MLFEVIIALSRHPFCPGGNGFLTAEVLDLLFAKVAEWMEPQEEPR